VGSTFELFLFFKGDKDDFEPINWQFAEKVIFPRLLKNTQMQGSRNLCRERFQTVPYGVAAISLPRA